MLEWIEAIENLGDPIYLMRQETPHSSHFITKVIKEEKYPNMRKIPLGQNLVIGQSQVSLVEVKIPNNYSQPCSIQKRRGRQ